MNKLAAALVAVLLTATVAEAQSAGRLFSAPRLPSTEELDRLNLVMGWYHYLPMDGRRDGIYSVQILDDQFLILLRSGTVLALDPATGAILWRNRVGVPYVPAVGFSSNSKLVFVAKGVNIFALSRSNGNIVWEFLLPHAPSASPVADDQMFFVPLGTNRLHAYTLPDLNAPRPVPISLAGTEKKEKFMDAAPKIHDPNMSIKTGPSAFGVSGQATQSVSAVASRGQSVRSVGPLSSAYEARQVGANLGPQPEPLWEYVTETRPETRLEQTSLLTNEYLFQSGANGLFFVLSKLEPRIFYKYQADAAVSAAIGGWGELAYVPSDDFRVYALDIVAGKILWRFVGGGPIRQKPRVTDESVYVSAERAGLYRLNRATGETVWRNPDAERFLAVNDKFVYATDTSGRLMILDRARGTQLAVYEGTRSFFVPLSNELNDRIYLASNDGLLISLHDRDHVKPMRIKNVPDMKPSINTQQEAKKKSAEKAPPKTLEKKKKDEDGSPDR